MTSRSRSIPATKVLGATDVAPTSSTRRLGPSGDSSPHALGTSRNPLAGCSPRTSSLPKATNTMTVSRIT